MCTRTVAALRLYRRPLLTLLSAFCNDPIAEWRWHREEDAYVALNAVR